MVWRAGRQFMSAQWEMSLLETLSWELAWKFVLCEQLLCLVGTTAHLADVDMTHFKEMFLAWLCTTLHSHLLCTPVCSQSSKDQQCNEKKLHTTLSLLYYAEDGDEVHMECLESRNDNSVYSRNQTYGNEPCLTIMCSLCHCCFPPNPKIHCKTVVGSPIPIQ